MALSDSDLDAAWTKARSKNGPQWVPYFEARVGLRATLLSVRGELASREAEIALLKKALMDAEAPQPTPTAQPAPAATPQADSQPSPSDEAILSAARNWGEVQQYNRTDGKGTEHRIVFNVHHRAAHFASELLAGRAPANSQPAHQRDTGYPPLPECDATTVGLGAVWNRHSMRAYADADRTARTQADSVCYDYAKQIAESMWATHYKADAPHWESCDSLMGVLSQISNMMCGLSRAPAGSVTAPAGPSKSLPYEPTSAMLIAARERDPALPIETVRSVYWAMWRTAPTPPTQAAPPAGREPLTEEQRSDIATAAAGFNWTDDVEAIDYVIDGVESLHGIKGGQHGTE